MKNIFLTILLIILILSPIRADEGMWIPKQLEQTQYKRMKELGMYLTPEDIYSVNQSSLKDAIVLFGTGCTGVVVSEKGLLFTNHHCGYRQIQSLSSLENDYLADGFWARSMGEELPNPGLTVSFLQRMEDVTEYVLKNITPQMNENQRADSIDAAILRIRRANIFVGAGASPAPTIDPAHYRVDIKPLYKGNQYYMYIYEIFSDVRLVGAPPSTIGKFGGDTDNWMWPRHTGDFAIFRIYADKDNRPTGYSPDNVPYQPKRHVQVSTSGFKIDDFTMVYGYPARTDEYLSSYELDYLVFNEYPARIAMRKKRMDIMNNHMKSDRAIGIQYAAKYSSVSNAWKRWQGVIRGISRIDGVNVKREYEEKFKHKIQSNPQWANDYGQLLSQIQQNTEQLKQYNMALVYYTETVSTIELVGLAGQYETAVNSRSNGVSKEKNIENFINTSLDFYKNYTQVIDKEIFVAMMKAYYENVPDNFHFDELNIKLKKHKGSFERWADEAYSQSVFRSQQTLHDALRKNIKSVEKDPFLEIFRSGRKMLAENVRTPYYRSLSLKSDSLSRVYMAIQMLTDNEKLFYPDANHTLRVTFGKTEGYSPVDAVEYKPYTTLEGLMEKDNSDIYDYRVPQALKETYKKGDFDIYTIYGTNTVPVNFIGSNHTSGGNSGSPVLNYNGELIGLNFDRNWEGTMSDLIYDPSQNRNIMVDIRYALFVTDKVYGAKWIVDELKLKCPCE